MFQLQQMQNITQSVQNLLGETPGQVRSSGKYWPIIVANGCCVIAVIMAVALSTFGMLGVAVAAWIYAAGAGVLSMYLYHNRYVVSIAESAALLSESSKRLVLIVQEMHKANKDLEVLWPKLLKSEKKLTDQMTEQKKKVDRLSVNTADQQQQLIQIRQQLPECVKSVEESKVAMQKFFERLPEIVNLLNPVSNAVNTFNTLTQSFKVAKKNMKKLMKSTEQQRVVKDVIDHHKALVGEMSAVIISLEEKLRSFEATAETVRSASQQSTQALYRSTDAIDETHNAALTRVQDTLKIAKKALSTTGGNVPGQNKPKSSKQ